MLDINLLIDEVITAETKTAKWPEKYFNREAQKFFEPQNKTIARHIFEVDTPRHIYIMSGEGGGKTASLAVLTLEKLRRGMSGAFVCVDLPMLLKVWQEFQRWIPWDCVIPEHQAMGAASWKPYRSLFEVGFMAENGKVSKLIIGGLGDEYSKWESLNINFFVIDEARSIPDQRIIKIATGRTRIMGPNGEPPQLIIGSTPTYDDHWMYDWFGPLKEEDPLADFKANSEIITLSSQANLQNLDPDYLKYRALSLTSSEREIFIDGKWGSAQGKNRFLDDLELWYRLYDPDLAPPKERNAGGKTWADALVVGMDGAIKDDSFALVAVSRNPKNRQDIAVRLVKEFKPVNGRIDFREVEHVLRAWCKTYNVITIVFDIYQIYDLTERLRKEGIAWFQEFSQNNKRALADNFLFEIIMQGRIAHRGQHELIEHLKHAGTKYDPMEKKRRIVKIRDDKKIDLVIALGMAAWECNRLTL